MSMHFSKLTEQVAADGAVDAQEILALRRAGWGDGRISPAEAEALFDINDNIENASPEWTDFFVEAIGETVVNGTEPRGYVSTEQAAWVIGQIKRDGRFCSMTELELVLRIFERAKNAPDSLKHFVENSIETAVLTGTGPTRRSGELSDAHVSQAEANILRRAIFAPASDGPARVSQREAEMLFRLKNACVDADNAPEWKRLFAQGVGNYLMGFSSENAQISRERAAELQAFVADNQANVGRFMGAMARNIPQTFDIVFGKKPVHVSRAEKMAEAQAVTSDEQSWLDAMIAENGQIDQYDQALLDFVAEDAG